MQYAKNVMFEYPNNKILTKEFQKQQKHKSK